MESKYIRSELIEKYKLFVVDLDNTLYNERDYLINGYKLISEYVDVENCTNNSGEYSDFLIKEFDSHGREKLFDKFLKHFGLKVSIESLLKILREQKTPIQLFPESKLLLDMLIDAQKKVYILTNGNIIQQQNKVELLGIKKNYPTIMVDYASLYEPKPSPLSLLHIIKSAEVLKEECIMIGDSDIDEMTALRTNIDFVYIKNIIL